MVVVVHASVSQQSGHCILTSTPARQLASLSCFEELLPIKQSCSSVVPITCLTLPCRKRPRQEFNQSPPASSQPVQPSLSSAPSAKAERRRFMSGKASDVHRAATPQAQPPKKRRLTGQSEGLGLSREDFLNMQREVQTFGEPCCYVLLSLSFCSQRKYTVAQCFLPHALLPLGEM